MPIDPAADRALATRALWRIMPLVVLCSVIGTKPSLDSANGP